MHLRLATAADGGACFSAGRGDTSAVPTLKPALAQRVPSGKVPVTPVTTTRKLPGLSYLIGPSTISPPGGTDASDLLCVLLPQSTVVPGLSVGAS